MKNKIKPKFNKNMPKNAKHYFNPASDDVFKAEHPNIYKILVACGITALMLPVFIYMAFILFIYPAPNSGWMLLGFAGAFIIGIGLFNIVAAWIGQYLGHLVSIICFAVGALMVLSSILLLYNHTLYDLFDQEMVTYYFINMLFMSLPIIFYVVFRSEIYNWLRARRISKSTIRKGEKGIKNFWWYEGINEKQNMGLLYYKFPLICPFAPRKTKVPLSSRAAVSHTQDRSIG